ELLQRIGRRLLGIPPDPDHRVRQHDAPGPLRIHLQTNEARVPPFTRRQQAYPPRPVVAHPNDLAILPRSYAVIQEHVDEEVAQTRIDGCIGHGALLRSMVGAARVDGESILVRGCSDLDALEWALRYAGRRRPNRARY